jgi:hypothetical protein
MPDTLPQYKKLQHFGFLSEKRLEYLLKTDFEKRQEIEKKDDGGQQLLKKIWNQYDYHIKRNAQQALIDLIVVAHGFPKKKTQKIFTIDMMQRLIDVIIHQQGWEETEKGIFFQALIAQIESSINAASLATSNPTQVRINVITSPRQPATTTNPNKVRELSGIFKGDWLMSLKYPKK